MMATDPDTIAAWVRYYDHHKVGGRWETPLTERKDMNQRRALLRYLHSVCPEAFLAVCCRDGITRQELAEVMALPPGWPLQHAA